MDIFEFFGTIITIFARKMFSRSQSSEPHEEPHPFENMFALMADTHYHKGRETVSGGSSIQKKDNLMKAGCQFLITIVPWQALTLLILFLEMLKF